MCCVAGNTCLGPCCHLGITPEPHWSWCPGVTILLCQESLWETPWKGVTEEAAQELQRATGLGLKLLPLSSRAGWKRWYYRLEPLEVTAAFAFRAEQGGSGCLQAGEEWKWRRKFALTAAELQHGERRASPAWASLPFRVNCSPCTLSFTAGFLQIFRKIWGKEVGHPS